ncbi:MAG TPA: hypothetical protein VG942_11540 [Hyphomonadaceae bacterium]|nr:hypothetical protein [Hyphomonadaceae bacterium]
MTHSVQLLIGKDPAIGRFLNRWKVARTVELAGGWLVVPMEEKLYTAIEAASPGTTRPAQLDLSPLGLEEAMIAATHDGGALVYIETDYWGGTGGQSAMAVADGLVTRQPERSRGAGGPVNSALRAIGVTRQGDKDEFDTIGLGERRTMEDYEPEGPRRLRAGPANPAPEADPKSTLPGWVVILLVALFVGAGIAIAQFR